MMEDARAGLFEQVVVKDISRVARNTVDFLQSIRVLKAMGINVVFLTANMTSLGDSEFILTIFGAMAQEESGNLSKRVKWGKKINAQKGRVPQRIYGYDRIDNFTLQINSAEAEVVRRIFRLYLDGGMGCRAVSLALNGDGIRTKFGCAWNPRGVRRVLANPIYCGHYVNNKYEVEDFLTGRQVRLPAEQHYHHDRPGWAIVSEEEFRRAQLQMAQRGGRKTPEGSAPGSRYSARHPLSTLIKCEHCGRSFCRRKYTYVNTRVYWVCSTNSQYTARRCDNRVKIEENELLAEIRDYFERIIPNQERFAGEILKDLEKRRPDMWDRTGAEEAGKKRGRLLAKRSRCQEMYANGAMTMAELKAKTEQIAGELAALEDGLARCAGQEDGGAEEEYLREIRGFLRLETAANPELRRIIDHIAVSRDGAVRVVLKKLDGGEPRPDFPSSCPW